MEGGGAGCYALGAGDGVLCMGGGGRGVMHGGGRGRGVRGAGCYARVETGDIWELVFLSWKSDVTSVKTFCYSSVGP